jgi:hypothetical protein
MVLVDGDVSAPRCVRYHRPMEVTPLKWFDLTARAGSRLQLPL